MSIAIKHYIGIVISLVNKKKKKESVHKDCLCILIKESKHVYYSNILEL